MNNELDELDKMEVLEAIDDARPIFSQTRTMNPVMSTEKVTPKHDSGSIELVFETDTPRKTREKLKGTISSQHVGKIVKEGINSSAGNILWRQDQ